MVKSTKKASLDISIASDLHKFSVPAGFAMRDPAGTGIHQCLDNEDGKDNGK